MPRPKTTTKSPDKIGPYLETLEKSDLIALYKSSPVIANNNNSGDNKTPSNNSVNNSTTNSDSPTVPDGMVFVKGAEFTMGTDKGEVAEMPSHLKTVKSFFMDKYEVTRADYEKCVTAGNCTAPAIWKTGTYPAGTAKFPVVGINY